VQIVRFRTHDKTRYGVLEGTVVIEYTGTPWSLFRRGRRRYPVRQVVLLAPVLPSKIVGVAPGRSASAAGDAAVADLLMFFKPVSALIGPDDPIVAPAACQHLESEPALAAVIKRRCRNVQPARAREYVLGYAGLNDVTARDIQARDGHCGRAKAFDTFCPLGPCITTDFDPGAATIETWVNGTLRAVGSPTELALAVEDVVARVSEVMTLLPGDVVATGAPGASGPLAAGDRVEIRIDGIGGLKNIVVRL
jgi:2-keto-4-pentenoate hydratase/2-oxohepta-3-ene-1,7-dioic acid hydratase in catechol pathway